MKTIFLFSIILIFGSSLSGQTLKPVKEKYIEAYGFYIPDEKVRQCIYDAIITVPGEQGTQFNIGKVCQEIGCEGVFDTTGKHQTAWEIYLDSIILVYVTPENGIFKTQILIYKYSERIKKFLLLK